MKTETKRCSKCRNDRPLDDFYAMKGTKDGKRPSCKECSKAHPEKSRAACRRWRERNKEHAQQLSRKWEQEHPERKKELRERWGAQHPDKVRFNSIKSCAKIHGMLFEISFLEWVDKFWRQPCAYCGGKSNGGIDRLDNGADYIATNCVPCCFLCNTIKRNMDLHNLITHLSRMLSGIKELLERPTTLVPCLDPP